MKTTATPSKTDNSSKNGSSANFFSKDASSQGGVAESMFFAPKSVQRSHITPDTPAVSPEIESKINSSKGSGSPMDPQTNAQMSHSFGTDLSQVSIHTGGPAVQLSQDLGAKAFTHGNDIYFNEGQYEPQSKQGQGLLAHELTHTIQQGGSSMIQKYDHKVSRGDTLGGLSSKYGVTEAQLRASNTSIPKNGIIQLGQMIWIPVREHKVISGDTIGGLAKKYGSSEADIKKANGLTTTRIRLGQKLIIPGFHKASQKRPKKAKVPAAKKSKVTTPVPGKTSGLPTGLLTGNPKVILKASQLKKLKYASGTTKRMDKWTQKTIDTYVKNIKTNRKPGNHATYIVRIKILITFRKTLQSTLVSNLKKGDDFLTLANIVYNEAGVFGAKAHAAVAYAWINRMRGKVGANKGADLSGYKKLSTRWAGFNFNSKLTFIEHFSSALKAASKVLNDPKRKTNDPTKGSVSWVSPHNLPAYNSKNPKHVKDRYSRDYQGYKNKAFPNWAFDHNDKAHLKRAKKNTWVNSKFRERTVKGVPSKHFLFYTGVIYIKR